ncbi:efflux RND transporter permease subunit [Paraliomyxa miuraensis]|uniref:efflux RND transporter permease subunit n=1 Tax=Paraliomyxa miuraensis TaxID=376150 RepID=UPI00224F45C6|nr:efflux RND transporter permease subunit [Paraliomyxa miuraensis]MCX4246498.1 efflux RND transporter permease subunit [Paraliomyxa miuraensis]
MIAWFTRHPTAANLLMLVLLLLGALGLPELQRETYPEFEANSLSVSASLPGADAEVMDQDVVARIEDVLGGMEGIASVSSSSREGGASVSVEVEDGFDIAALLADVRSAVESIKDFPDAMEEPSVTLRSRTRSVLTIAVTGPMSGQDLLLYLERLKRRLLTFDDVSQVTIAGFSTHQLRIRLDASELASYGLDVQTVAAALAAQSLDSPLGSLETRAGNLLVRYSDRRTTPEALESLVVATAADGGEIRLGDVADVEDAFAVEEEQTYFNGQRAGMLVVGKASTEDSLDVRAAVQEFLDEQERLKPDGVELTITNDSTAVIEDRLTLLLLNGLQGLLLVFVTLWIFFELRLAFWVAAGLPVSFLSALWLMQQTGQTLNMMTMMGLLVALGLLMDDAIVLAENVASHLSRGARPLQAAISGVSEVAGGVLSSFVTTICVFVPLSAIDGRIGRTLQVIPAVLIAVLAVSLLEAFFILPNHLGHSLRADRRPGRVRQRFDSAFERLRERGLGRVVDFAVRHRYGVVAFTIAAFLGCIGAVQGGQLRYQAFPDAEGNLVEFRLAMPVGTSLDRTKLEVERVVEAAERAGAALDPEQPDGARLVRNTSVRFNYNPDADGTGPNVATVSVDLLAVEHRNTTLAEFTERWRKELGTIPDAVSAKFGSGGRGGPGGNPIEVRMLGDDLDRLEEVAERTKQWLAREPAVSDLGDDLEPGLLQVRIRLRPGAGATGQTGATLAAYIRSALNGIAVETLYHEGEQFEVFVELEARARDSLRDLERFPIPVGEGVTVPLGSIAHVETTHGYAGIRRRDGARTVTVTGSIDREQANLVQLMTRFREEAVPELEAEFPDVRIELGGEMEDSAQTLGSMGHGLALGCFAIFALLSLQFRSYLEPVVVMLAIPFAFVGVVLGSLALSMPLSSQSVLGFVSLAGVVVNDSILLMVFIKNARADGASPAQAAVRASRDRFRAVLLTSATTIAGLVPLMFETSRQAQMLIPVASSIVFGITASTVLVLVVLPAAYAILGDLGLAASPAGDEHGPASDH